MTDLWSYFNKREINFTFYAYLYITINIYATFCNIYKRFNAINTAFFAKMRFKAAYFFKGYLYFVGILDGLKSILDVYNFPIFYEHKIDLFIK